MIQVIEISGSGVEKRDLGRELRVRRDRDRELKSRYNGNSGFKVIGIWS